MAKATKAAAKKTVKKAAAKKNNGTKSSSIGPGSLATGSNSVPSKKKFSDHQQNVKAETAKKKLGNSAAQQQGNNGLPAQMRKYDGE
jgi:hypothetical protein